MQIEDDPLYQRVEKRRNWFRQEAAKHKRLNRWLWFASTAVSVLIAFGTSFTLPLGPVTSTQIAAALAIVLPAVTAFTVLRSPEQLWILETSMRNRLNDLLTQMELEFHADPNFDRRVIREDFLRLSKEASEGWVKIKAGS